MTFSEEESARMVRDHWARYDEFARKIGVDRLKRLVPATPEELKEKYAIDPFLNNIDLRRWDAAHGSVNRMRNVRPKGGWSLADTVCLLKHVAVFHIIGDTLENSIERRRL